MKENNPAIKRRETLKKNRQIRHIKQNEVVRDFLGKIEPGCEIFGLTNGGFSLINLIENCLEQVGPADVVISTWTAADADLRMAEEFLRNGLIESLRFLVDASFYSRKPEYCRMLIDEFGEGAIRASKSHAKFVLIGSDKWNLVIRTSANLNENKRTENFEISDDADFYRFMLGFVDNHFERPLDFTQGDREDDAMTGGFGLRRLNLA